MYMDVVKFSEHNFNCQICSMFFVYSQEHYISNCKKYKKEKEISNVMSNPAVSPQQSQGCDAAVLIASKNNDAEKDAEDNESLAGDGFDTINRVKDAVEKKCPGVVSCADIIALAARDVVYLVTNHTHRLHLSSLRSSQSGP